jgi:tetratricopeptide (TPR) repeat protein
MLMLASSLAHGAATSSTDCGSLANHYGPYDYTNPDHFHNRLPVVEQHHFTSKVENLISGESATLEQDLNYTLRTFPNHHRALWSVARLQLKTPRPLGGDPTYLTAECYFERAIQFSPQDGTARMVYGIYLHKKGEHANALAQYKDALQLMPNSSEAHYNVGLLYLDMNNMVAAREHAEKAYSMGYPLQGLKNRLVQAGQWKPPADSGKNR